MNDSPIIKNDWYEKLLNDLKKLEFTGIVLTKWNIGKRINQDIKKFGETKYGSHRIENIAKDSGISVADIYNCIKFYTKFPEFSNGVRELSWREIVNKHLYLPKPKPKTPPLPQGKYQIIYADPSWSYYAGGYKNQSQHYDGMSIDEICELPVKDLAAENCILFIWATFPILPDVFKVIEKWGFKYSTVGFVWVKSKKDKTGFAFGLGNWTRSNVELCLIATKGSIERKDASISQIIYEPLEEHSKKPDIVRDKIIQLVGDLHRVELFARGKLPEGWQGWGIEYNK